jgi:hypothetical protein
VQRNTMERARSGALPQPVAWHEKTPYGTVPYMISWQPARRGMAHNADELIIELTTLAIFFALQSALMLRIMPDRMWVAATGLASLSTPSQHMPPAQAWTAHDPSAPH